MIQFIKTAVMIRACDTSSNCKLAQQCKYLWLVKNGKQVKILYFQRENNRDSGLTLARKSHTITKTIFVSWGITKIQTIKNNLRCFASTHLCILSKNLILVTWCYFRGSFLSTISSTSTYLSLDGLSSFWCIYTCLTLLQI